LLLPTVDGCGVVIVILLVGPEGDPRQMLRVLSRLARLVRSADFLDTLRAAKTAGELCQAFGLAHENGD